MTERSPHPHPPPTGDESTEPDGPRIGLASYEANDPIGTFRPIEPYRPPPDRPLAHALSSRPLRLFAVFLVNLGTLAVAGLLLTNIGPSDPFAYVIWAALFGLGGVLIRPAARLAQGPRVAGTYAAILLVANVLLIWLMTVLAPPFHAPDLLSIGKAALVMALVNLLLGLLALIHTPRAGGRPSAGPGG